MYGSSPRSHQQRLVSSFATWLLIMMLEELTITPSLKYFMQLDKVMYIQEARVLKVAENKHLCKEDWMVSWNDTFFWFDMDSAWLCYIALTSKIAKHVNIKHSWKIAQFANYEFWRYLFLNLSTHTPVWEETRSRTWYWISMWTTPWWCWTQLLVPIPKDSLRDLAGTFFQLFSVS